MSVTRVVYTPLLVTCFNKLIDRNSNVKDRLLLVRNLFVCFSVKEETEQKYN